MEKARTLIFRGDSLINEGGGAAGGKKKWQRLKDQMAELF